MLIAADDDGQRQRKWAPYSLTHIHCCTRTACPLLPPCRAEREKLRKEEERAREAERAEREKRKVGPFEAWLNQRGHIEFETKLALELVGLGTGIEH